MLTLLVVLAALTGDLPFEAHGGGPAVDAPHTRVRLVARENVQPGDKTIDVAIELESDAGWHTYWKNPGDAGMATSVTWTLPKGWKAGELAWPTPSRFQEKDIVTFGYGGTVWLLSTLEPVSTQPGGEASVAAHVEWLECREVCLPGAADVSFTLPARQPDANSDAFAKARARIPESSDGWKVRSSWTKAKTLLVELVAAAPLAADAAFFPDAPGIVESSGPVTFTAGAKGGYLLELPSARMAVGTPSVLEGVLVSGGRAWHVRVPLPPKKG